MMDLLITVSWVLMGAACAYHAKRRGRAPLAWFGIGLLFGIFALIALLLLPPRQKGSEGKRLFGRQPTPQQVPTFPPPVAPEFAPLAKEHRLWYFLDQEHKQWGPMSLHALHGAWQEGRVHSASYVWNEDFEEWKVLGDLLQKT